MLISPQERARQNNLSFYFKILHSVLTSHQPPHSQVLHTDPPPYKVGSKMWILKTAMARIKSLQAQLKLDDIRRQRYHGNCVNNTDMVVPDVHQNDMYFDDSFANQHSNLQMGFSSQSPMTRKYLWTSINDTSDQCHKTLHENNRQILTELPVNSNCPHSSLQTTFNPGTYDVTDDSGIIDMSLSSTHVRRDVTPQGQRSFHSGHFWTSTPQVGNSPTNNSQPLTDFSASHLSSPVPDNFLVGQHSSSGTDGHFTHSSHLGNSFANQDDNGCLDLRTNFRHSIPSQNSPKPIYPEFKSPPAPVWSYDESTGYYSYSGPSDVTPASECEDLSRSSDSAKSEIFSPERLSLTSSELSVSYRSEKHRNKRKLEF